MDARISTDAGVVVYRYLTERRVPLGLGLFWRRSANGWLAAYVFKVALSRQLRGFDIDAAVHVLARALEPSRGRMSDEDLRRFVQPEMGLPKARVRFRWECARVRLLEYFVEPLSHQETRLLVATAETRLARAVRTGRRKSRQAGRTLAASRDVVDDIPSPQSIEARTLTAYVREGVEPPSQPASTAMFAMTEKIYARCFDVARRSRINLGDRSWAPSQRIDGFADIVAAIVSLVDGLGIYDAEFDQWLVEAEQGL